MHSTLNYRPQLLTQAAGGAGHGWVDAAALYAVEL